MKEINIIRSIYPKKANLMDDCFFLDNKYLITTDTISEKTHFKHEWSSASDLAFKLLHVNISDIAASGGVPKLAFLNLGLSKVSSKSAWIQPFLSTLKKQMKKFGITIAGGDTYSSPFTNLTLTLLGESDTQIARSGGKIGDRIYITGNLGLSNYGLSILSQGLKAENRLEKDAVKKHLRPESRLQVSRSLIKKYKIHAMMDITDGLVQDSRKLALASGLHLEIHIEKIPALENFSKKMTIDSILTSGEELELLFLSPDKIDGDRIGFPVSEIGTAYKKGGAVDFKLNLRNYTVKEKSFNHF